MSSTYDDPVNRRLFDVLADGKTEDARQMIRQGADPNCRNMWGASPILYAAKNGIPRDLIMLLEEGAEPDIRDSYGKVPLHYAAEKGYNTCVQVLVNIGADVNAKDKDGITPFWEAAYMGHLDCMETLALAGADIYAKDDQGRIALNIYRKKFPESYDLHGEHIKSLDFRARALEINDRQQDVKSGFEFDI